MKNSKKLFLIFLSVLIVAFISCKKDSGGSITTPTPTFKLSSLVGTWKDAKNNTFKVGSTGKITDITINGQSATGKEIQINNWDKGKDTEVEKHTESLEQVSIGNHTFDFKFTFTSASSCVVSSTEDGKTTNTFTLTKEKAATTK